jgi:alkylation response protein AidB-like acyl-CoA dehydrogenase
MDIRYPPEAEQYREHVRAFLAEHLPADWKGLGTLDEGEYRDFVLSWRKTLYEHDLLAPAWPTEFGGAGLSPLEQIVLAEEFARVGAPTGTTSDEFSIDMLGNTLLQLGTEEQKAYFLPRILSGEIVWCQGFSEPNAGSDLANVSTKAVRDGDEWVVNGQKIWTSDGLYANWIFVLARTDTSAAKHRGLSFLLVPIEQEGVELRPIRMVPGQAEFCETFFTDARTSAQHVLGEVNGGWKVAMHLLGHERGQTSVSLPIRFRQDLDRLVELARERGVLDDPAIRRRLAWCYSRVQIMRGLGWRMATSWLQGQTPGPEASVYKLFWTEYHVDMGRLAIDIMGEEGLLTSGRPPEKPYEMDDVGAANSTASWQGSMLNALGGPIYAGSSEIQRNIIGEQVLGLPREPRPVPA